MSFKALFSPESVKAFNDIWPSVLQHGAAARELWKQKKRNQPRNIPEEDKIMNVDISIAIDIAIANALRPWIDRISQPISPKDIHVEEHKGSGFYGCTYHGNKYLVSHVASLSIVRTLYTMLALLDLKPSFFLAPVSIHTLTSEDINTFGDSDKRVSHGSQRDGATGFRGLWSEGDLILLYEYAEELNSPTFLDKEGTAYLTHAFCRLLHEKIDLRDMEVIFFDGSFKIDPTTAFSFERLTYQQSIAFLQDSFSDKVEERNPQMVKEFYIEELSKYSDDDISVVDMAKIFDCMYDFSYKDR